MINAYIIVAIEITLFLCVVSSIAVYLQIRKETKKLHHYWHLLYINLQARHTYLLKLIKTSGMCSKNTVTTLKKVIKDCQKAFGKTSIIQKELILNGQLDILYNDIETHKTGHKKEVLIILDKLEALEFQIKTCGEYYNNAVIDFNIKTRQFPASLIAKLLGYSLANFIDDILPSKTSKHTKKSKKKHTSTH